MIQRVILWFVGLLPKKLQQIYARYEEQWLYLIYGVLTTVVGNQTGSAVFGSSGCCFQSVLYHLFCRLCGVFLDLCCDVCVLYQSKVCV